MESSIYVYIYMYRSIYPSIHPSTHISTLHLSIYFIIIAQCFGFLQCMSRILNSSNNNTVLCIYYKNSTSFFSWYSFSVPMFTSTIFINNKFKDLHLKFNIFISFAIYSIKFNPISRKGFPTLNFYFCKNGLCFSIHRMF